jgi:SAM-dependent methyltransferase
LPFRDNAFDAVVSNYVIHEVQLAEERQQLMAELVRVLKPGGHIAVVDFIFTKDCVEAFQRGGIPNARRDRISPLNFWVGVIMSLGSTQTYLVTGCKNNP